MRTLKTAWFAGIVGCVLVLALAGCGSDDEGDTNGSQGTNQSAETSASIGMALPGPINDRGYNEGIYNGLKAAGEQGHDVNHVESLEDPSAALDAIQNLARGNDLVIIAGGQFTDIAVTAAKSSPETQFALIDGAPTEPIENLHPYVIQYQENGYLAGVAAVAMTTSGRVAFIGGLDIPPVQLSEVGFTAAVDKAQTSVRAATTSTGSFNDVGAAKETASAQIAAGADVLFPFVDAAYTGVTQAAAEAAGKVGVLVSNRSASVCGESPSVSGATTVKYPNVVLEIVEDYTSEELTPDVVTPGVGDGTLGTEFCEGRVDQEVVSAVEDAATEIRSGAIEVPRE